MVKICEVCGLKQSPGCDKTFHRFETSTSATSGLLLKLENIPPMYGSALSEEKCKDNDESTDMQETFSTLTVRSPQMISNPRKRKTNWCNEGSVSKKNIRYFGDLDSDNMEDAKNRRKCFQIARNTISKQRAKIRQLQQSNRRMSHKIKTLKLLTQHLRNHNMISENAECTLNASLSGASKELFNWMLKSLEHKSIHQN
ncbi:uncharacterized protein isoform X2 [Leptinotarsa decemlineata]|uniref:uncharacterized protein isoform X2 n=1 Tax=Leptinotarsa decemlineata TaxID=7539 RepID=UPI003D30C3AE